jgi:hypothetical protein
MLSATSHWMYMTLRRMGRDLEAQALLKPIEASMDIIENHAYHQLLLMYKGERTVAELLERSVAGDTLDHSTIGYGLANWSAFGGDEQTAHEQFRQLLEDRQWAAFGYIAAEADVARRLQRDRPSQPDDEPVAPPRESRP